MVSELRQLIDINLKESLFNSGFKEIRLRNCIHPEFLYKKERIWFGVSWDYRDRYLEINLGYLYWFKDVMPRVIVLGDYFGDYVNTLEIPSMVTGELTPIFKEVNKTFPDVILKYEYSYQEILSKYLHPPMPTKFWKQFSLHLGNEVNIKELSVYLE